MKKILRITKKSLLFLTLSIPLPLLAQDEADGLIKGSAADATKLLSAYFNPVFKGVGVGLNSGWATSAKTAGFLRFDVRVSGALAYAPETDKSFDVLALDLQTLRPTNLTNTISPTVIGSNKSGVEMVNQFGPQKPFNLPNATSLQVIPSPQVQATFGVLDNVDISLRYLFFPFLENYGRFNILGAGAKVEILPLILGKTGKMLPVEIAIAGGYSQLKYKKSLDLNNGTYNDQVLDATIDGYSAEAIVSKKITFFTPFASVGYHKSAHQLNALGTYELGGSTVKDPVRISESTVSNIKATAGFQLKFVFFKLYAAYSVSDYNYMNIGVGFGTSK